MQILLSSSEKKSLKRLLEIKELNIASSNAYFEFSFSKYKPSEILDFLDLNLENEEDLFFYEKYFKDNIVMLNKDKYINNPYAKIFQNVDIKDTNYRLTHLKIKPYQILPFDDIKVNEKEDYLEKSQIGYFKEKYKYFAITKDNVVWMSTDPNEINTMEAYINLVHGHLLVFGLGLGYFPYMSYLKGNIKEITIIENDQKVIDIFNAYIKDKLDIKIPLHIVKSDAFTYIKNHDLSSFDSVFVDIWHSPEDGLPLYIKFKSLFKKYNLDIYYWLNKSLIAMFRRCVLTLFEENLLGYKDDKYLKEENEYDQIINKLYFYLKSYKFNNYQEIINFLNDDNLQNLIINCF